MNKNNTEIYTPIVTKSKEVKRFQVNEKLAAILATVLIFVGGVLLRNNLTLSEEQTTLPDGRSTLPDGRSTRSDGRSTRSDGRSPRSDGQSPRSDGQSPRSKEPPIFSEKDFDVEELPKPPLISSEVLADTSVYVLVCLDCGSIIAEESWKTHWR